MTIATDEPIMPTECNMVRIRIIQAVLIALLSSCPVLSAGEPGADLRADWSRVHSISPGRRIAVEAFQQAAKTIKGTFVSASDQALVVRLKDGHETVIERKNIQKVKLRGSRGKNALLGLAIGAGTGIIAGAIADRGPSEGGEGNIGKKIFTVLGAILGSGIGALMPASKTVYEVPEQLQRRAGDSP